MTSATRIPPQSFHHVPAAELRGHEKGLPNKPLALWHSRHEKQCSGLCSAWISDNLLSHLGRFIYTPDDIWKHKPGATEG